MNLKEFCYRESYTWQHKKAFLRIEKKVLGHNTFRGYLHDADKLLFLYFLAVILNCDAKWVHNIHRKHCRHHAENKYTKTRKDYIEMIIDWECARYTKPDKPLNAYNTMKKYYPNLEPYVLPLIKELGLDTK
jgi:hypothetical protein